MKIILLCSNNPNQIALANKVADQFDLVGVVAESKKRKKALFLFNIFYKIIDKIFFYSIHQGWISLMNYYKKKYPCFPKSSILNVENINSSETVEFILRHKPDLLMVSGTSLVKNNILSLNIPKGIINLHTGLSPYVKGGPNCTNWCIANNDFHLIGNTVMWIDDGIDSGNIILSDVVDFNGDESLNEIHLKVMEHAHHLYLSALKNIKGNNKVPSVSQKSIDQGRVFYTREWNFKKKRMLLKNLSGYNFKEKINSEQYKKLRQRLILIK